MIRTRRVVAASAAALLALVVTACGGDDSSSSNTTAAPPSSGSTASSGATGSTTNEKLSGTLNASGATFPQAFYEQTISDFAQKQSGVTINYSGGGSGKGRQDLADQVTDWAGSDSPIPDADKAKFKGGDVLYFPTVVAPITVSFNLDGVDKLQLSPDTIAKIFSRQVKTWNDAAIAADNPGVTLPSDAITVVRRSDSSGTTANFTKFLVAAAPSSWSLKSGSTVEWPADTQGGNGNGGVAQLVKSTKGAIGYVDFSDAKASELSFAAVKNQAGKYVEATLDGATAAAEKATINADLTYSAIWAAGDGTYPITAQTWVLVYAKQTDKAKGAAVKAWINYLLTDGQKTAPEVDFAPLPSALAQQAIAQLAKIQLPS